MIAHCIGSSSHSSHVARACVIVECCFWSLRHLHSLLLLPHHLSDHPVLPTARQLQLPRCGHTLRTSAEDLGTLCRDDPLTSYEPNDHFITEVDVEYTQESTGEQRFTDDFDNDDVTIGKTLLDARRRRADHSEEEGLSSCLSSSVRRDRTERPVVCSLGSQVSSAQETQRHNFESEQIKTLLERDKKRASSRWLSSRDSKKRIPGRLRLKKYSKIVRNDRVAKKKKLVVLIKETNDVDKINKFFMNSYWSKIGIFVKLVSKASVKWKNWSDFKVQQSTQLRGENWSKIEILSLNLQARYRNCEMKTIVW